MPWDKAGSRASNDDTIIKAKTMFFAMPRVSLCFVVMRQLIGAYEKIKAREDDFKLTLTVVKTIME